ncbi:MAG: hypothetical protein WCD76_20795 [Pyrinomonadaceae bacterium]
MNALIETVLKEFRDQSFRGSTSHTARSSLFEQLIQDQPSPEMYFSLRQRLMREAELTREEIRRQAHARAWELAKQQGVKPVGDIKELQGDFWPEEESVDEFLTWVRDTRRQVKVGAEE